MIACMDRALGLARVQTPFPASGESNPEIFDCCDTNPFHPLCIPCLALATTTHNIYKGRRISTFRPLPREAARQQQGGVHLENKGPQMALTTMTPRNALHGIPLRCGRYQLGADKRRYIGRTTRRTNTACLTR
jgi:hypothetical protein